MQSSRYQHLLADTGCLNSQRSCVCVSKMYSIRLWRSLWRELCLLVALPGAYLQNEWIHARNCSKCETLTWLRTDFHSEGSIAVDIWVVHFIFSAVVVFNFFFGSGWWRFATCAYPGFKRWRGLETFEKIVHSDTRPYGLTLHQAFPWGRLPSLESQLVLESRLRSHSCKVCFSQGSKRGEK